MDTKEVREAVLEAVEVSLEAQLRAVRKLRKTDGAPEPEKKSGRSQLDMAYDILSRSKAPMHVTQIIEAIRHKFGAEVDRESLVSAIAKRVVREDRFERIDRNTFAARKQA